MGCLYLYLCIFLHIFMYIYSYFHVYLYIFSCIFLLISTYLPQKCGILLLFATKVCCFTTDCHKCVLHLLQFTGIYLYLPHKCGILLQFDTKVWHIRAPKCARKTGTNKLCAQCATFLALIWHRI